MLDDLSDADLVHQCRQGRAAAWGTLVRRFQRLVYTVPRRAGLSDAQAADVFQTTFARLVEHLDRLDDPSRVHAWLVTTARRETLRLLEAQRRFVDLDALEATRSHDDDAPATSAIERIPDPAPGPERALAEVQSLDRLRRALDRLEPRLRQLLELLFLQDEPPSYAEISQRLGMPEGSIGPTRARALAKLRAQLARDGLGPFDPGVSGVRPPAL